MSVCNSCGGIIGRDCFNPQECAWITQQMEVASAVQNERQFAGIEHRMQIEHHKKEIDLLKVELDRKTKLLRQIKNCKHSSCDCGIPDEVFEQIDELISEGASQCPPPLPVTASVVRAILSGEQP